MKLAQTNFSTVFYSCIPTGMHGPTGIFWASLTTFPLQDRTRAGALALGRTGTAAPAAPPADGGEAEAAALTLELTEASPATGGGVMTCRPPSTHAQRYVQS
jgi:hypothetical protein